MCFMQNRIKISIAGLVIEISSPSDRTQYQCYKYLSNSVPTIFVHLSKQELDQEIKKYEKLGIVNKNMVYINNDNHIIVTVNEMNEAVIETTAVYRKIVEAVLPYDILLMHGAVVARGKESFMFTGPSGTGKTTHIKKWLEYGEDTYVVNGDKPLLKILENEVVACGTPWCGKEQMSTNTMVPLKAIILMERCEYNHIERITFDKAYTFLIKQIYLPNDKKSVIMTLDLFNKLEGRVEFYLFRFNNFKEECFDIAYKTLVGNK